MPSDPHFTDFGRILPCFLTSIWTPGGGLLPPKVEKTPKNSILGGSERASRVGSPGRRPPLNPMAERLSPGRPCASPAGAPRLAPDAVPRGPLLRRHGRGMVFVGFFMLPLRGAQQRRDRVKQSDYGGRGIAQPRNPRHKSWSHQACPPPALCGGQTAPWAGVAPSATDSLMQSMLPTP
jgi:hypothetical protein